MKHSAFINCLLLFGISMTIMIVLPFVYKLLLGRHILNKYSLLLRDNHLRRVPQPSPCRSQFLHLRVSVDKNVAEGARRIRQLEESGLVSLGGSGSRGPKAPPQVEPRKKSHLPHGPYSRVQDGAFVCTLLYFHARFQKWGPLLSPSALEESRLVQEAAAGPVLE